MQQGTFPGGGGNASGVLPLVVPAPAPSPLARIYDAPCLELPADLYIPPDALQVILEAFEGPLDLLLYLIRKANIDILDIPMAPLTAQYLGYIDVMRASNLELAADYLVMAAMLIEIKSRMLLPRPRASEEAEVGDPRAELVRRLVEYERMKQGAQQIDALPQAGRDFWWPDVLVDRLGVARLPDVGLPDLQDAWRGLVERAQLNSHHHVRREALSVREHMGLILRQLQSAADWVSFEALFEDAPDMPRLVVRFLALLELVRESLVRVSQAEPFAPIYVGLPGQENARQGETHGVC